MNDSIVRGRDQNWQLQDEINFIFEPEFQDFSPILKVWLLSNNLRRIQIPGEGGSEVRRTFSAYVSFCPLEPDHFFFKFRLISPLIFRVASPRECSKSFNVRFFSDRAFICHSSITESLSRRKFRRYIELPRALSFEFAFLGTALGSQRLFIVGTHCGLLFQFFFFFWSRHVCCSYIFHKNMYTVWVIFSQGKLCFLSRFSSND